MGHKTVRSPCVICLKFTAFTNTEGNPACLTHGGILPETIQREQMFTGYKPEESGWAIDDPRYGPSPLTTVILPGRDKWIISNAAQGDSAPADNGGWFAVYMRKLLSDPIQYPITRIAGRKG